MGLIREQQAELAMRAASMLEVLKERNDINTNYRLWTFVH